MREKTFVKKAGILMLAAAFFLPAAAVAATTDPAATTLQGGVSTVVNTATPARDVIWDNGLPDARNGVSCGSWGTYTREVCDDFLLTDSAVINSAEFRTVFYTAGTPPTGMTAVLIEIYPDSAGAPSTTAYASKTATFSGVYTGNSYFSRPEILWTATFEDIALTAGTWWFSMYPTVIENHFWLTSDKPGTSQIYVSYPDLGAPKWTPGYPSQFTDEYDVSFVLIGGAGEDTTPPETTCTLDGEMSGSDYITDVTATLSATDDISGVNYTMYCVDGGDWVEYVDPFVVSGNGAHTIEFYSVDNAGNIEENKIAEFTIRYPSNITIGIAGGIGVKATLTNTGTEDVTAVPWTIECSGSLIFIGKTKSGTVDIAAGASATVKSFVIGFGAATITVTADTAVETGQGTVILFFVMVA